jgi:hypothetical protein
MNTIFSVAFYISLVLTHPLESVHRADSKLLDSLSPATQGQYYIAPRDGMINEVIKTDGLFQIKILLDDSTVIVYSGLSELYKDKEDRVLVGEVIGKDNTITTSTKYLIMLYEKAVIFPQFNGNNLIFAVNSGTPVYMTGDAKMLNPGYDSKKLGNYAQYELIGKKVNITYSHFNALYNKKDTIAQQGELAVTAGSSGAITNSGVTLQFAGTDLGTDIRVIYFKDVVSPN